MAAKLSTHVLDTAHGCPAAGMKIELWSLDDSEPVLVTTAKTNAASVTQRHSRGTTRAVATRRGAFRAAMEDLAMRIS